MTVPAWRSPLHSLAAVLLVVAVAPSLAQEPPHTSLTEAFSDPITPEAAAWRADLAALAEALETRHLDPFHWTPRDTFYAAVEQLHAHIPALARHEIIVGLARVVATLGDAHTALPLSLPDVGFHALPIELHHFHDGLFVRAAAPEYAQLVGGRVVRIGPATAEAALAAAAKLVSHENEFWARQRAPQYLQIPEVLHALGLADTPEAALFTIEQGDTAQTVALSAMEPARMMGHGSPLASPRDWARLFDAAQDDPPLWLRQPGTAYWSTYLPEERLLYVNYRAVVNMQGGPSNAAFFHHVFALADSLRPDRFVLDVRENGGGNGFYNRALVRHVIQRPWLDQPDRFFVIIGRGTFSAGIQLVNDLEYFTNATLVGEPTGNAPNQFGDALPFQLPHSGLSVWISTRWHQSRRPGRDQRFVAPRLFAPLTSEAYRAGTDPALDAVRSYGATPPLRDQLAEALEADDTLRAIHLFEAYSADPLHAYADVEGEINALGYALLDTGQMEHALVVFRLNAGAYPHSANVFDSLGEAYERSGRREAAAAAYRRALRLDPNFSSSREGLRRTTGGSARTDHAP